MQYKYKGYTLKQSEKHNHHYRIFDEDGRMVMHVPYNKPLSKQEAEECIDNCVLFTGKVEKILYFTLLSTEAIYFLEELSELMHIHGIPCTINYWNMTLETENYKFYAVSACSASIGALPGFKYYINHATEERFAQRVKFKLLEGAKELKTIDELIEVLKH